MASINTLRRLTKRTIGRRFVRDAGVLGAANGFVAVIAIVQGLLIARWLGAELYGVFALTIAYPSLIHAVLHARGGQAAVKYLSEFGAKRDWSGARAMAQLSYAVDLAAGLGTVAIVAGTAWWAEGRIIHADGMALPAILYAAALVPRSLYGSSHAVLSTLRRFPLIGLVDIVSAMARAGLVLGLVAGGFGVRGAIVGSAIGIALQGVLAVVVSYPIARRAWNGSWVTARLSDLRGRQREIFRFIGFSGLGDLVGVLTKQADILLLGALAGPEGAGFYRLAKAVSGSVGYLVIPLQAVTYPRFAHLAALGKQGELRKLTVRLGVFIGLPAGALVLGALPLVSRLLLPVVGPDYGAAVGIVQLLLVSSAVWLTLFWLRPLYFARGQIAVWVSFTAALSFMLVVGFAIAAPLWGYVGVALVSAVTHTVGHVVAGAWALRQFRAAAWTTKVGEAPPA